MKRIGQMAEEVLQTNMPYRTFKLNKQEYEEFKRCYTLIALRGLSYGEAFCEYFDIHDYLIQRDTDNNRVDKLIKHTYLRRQQVVQKRFKVDK